jgi:hypothetical protein
LNEFLTFDDCARAVADSVSDYAQDPLDSDESAANFGIESS